MWPVVGARSWIAGLGRAVPEAVVWGALLSGSPGCQSCESAPSPAPATPPVGERTVPPADGAPTNGPSWRYQVELNAAARGRACRPVLELSRADRGEAWVVAVIDAPAGATPAVSLELLHLRAPEHGADLVPEGPLSPLVRARATDERTPALEALRRERAAPQAVLVRPLGWPLDDVAELPRRLSALAGVARSAGSDHERVDALVEVVRVLDDALVFDRDRLHEIVDTFAAGPWTVEGTTKASEHRASLQLAGPGGALEVSLLRKTGGWVVADVQSLPSRAPAADPSPTKP
jgi:hypothetical protein